MDAFGLPLSPQNGVAVFTGNSVSAGASWETYVVPQGKGMLHILVIGGGGGGGSGVIGANSVSAGGGGGGSGGQTAVTIPTALLPKTLYVSVGAAKTGTGVASYVATQPQTATTQHVVCMANAGGAGGNASAGTGGAAGSAASIANNTFPLGQGFNTIALAGQAGIIGGAAIAGGALTYPATGLRITGGTGGGGLPAAAATGTAGGAITAIAAPSYFLGLPGGLTQATATNPANPGQNGSMHREAGFFFYGGTGGGSTHGTATGGGLVQAAGGNGGIGSGGGGMGGALTGSAAASLSLGGPGLVIITAF